MIKGYYFRNYKAFKEGEIEIRPITLIIGKNSSGKSSICKLLPLLSKSLSNNLHAPFLLDNNGVSVGARYNDVFRNHANSGLVLGVMTNDGKQLESELMINNGLLSRYSSRIIDDDAIVEYPANNDKQDGLFSKSFLLKINLKRGALKMSVDYISPIRREAQYAIRYKGKGFCGKVGDDGANAYDILIDSFLDGSSIFRNVSSWMQENMEGQKLVIKRLGAESEVFGFYIDRHGVLVNLADVGQGVSQLLPIIVQSFLPVSQKADVTVIEQPALHLHPAAHAAVAERLARSAKRSKKKYVIESHSENVLLCFRKLVATGVLQKDDVIIYYVDNEDFEATIQTITINENGRLSSWPEGVYSEGFDLMASIYSV